MENVLNGLRDVKDPCMPLGFVPVQREVVVGSRDPVKMLITVGEMPAGAKGTFPLRLGTIKQDIVGGPFRSKPPGFYGIKMAEEINADCVISIPTKDYCVPDRGRLIAGLYAGITLVQQQCPLWVGCMGGIGRTGLYFGALAKVMAGYQKLTKHKVTIEPVRYVRQTYLSHALETQQQEQWVVDLDVYDVVQWVAHLQGYKPSWWGKIKTRLSY